MADIKYATVKQTGNGVKTNWDFNFSGATGTPGYISQAHVKCYTLDLSGSRTDRTFTWVGPNTINVTPAVANGWTIVIYRDTPKDMPLVDFETTAVLNETALDTSARQAIYVAAETTDAFGDTKQLVDGVQGNVEAAQAAQAGAEAAAAAAEVSKNQAVAQVTLATAQAVASAASAAASQTSATNSQTSATNSQNSATASAASAAAAAATYLGFDKRYLGAKATAPALDNQGAALAAGAVYYNTTIPQWYVYDLALGWQVPTNNVLRTGSGAPSAGVGLNGDTYYDFTNYAIYGPKAGGAWGPGTSLIGPPGPGTGDVTGPAASLDSEVAIFNGSTGKAIKRSALSAAVVRIVSGVMTAATAAVHYIAPGAIASANGLTMATARLLGRTSSGTGQIEEISVGSGMSLTGGVLSVVPAGSTLLATISPTVSANVDALSVFSSAYDNYVIYIEGILPTTSDVLAMRAANAGVVDTTTANYTAALARFQISGSNQNTLNTGKGFNSTVTVLNVNATATMKTVSSVGARQRDATPTYDAISISDSYVAANAMSGFRLYWAGGSTFQAVGIIRVFGISNV